VSHCNGGRGSTAVQAESREKRISELEQKLAEAQEKIIKLEHELAEKRGKLSITQRDLERALTSLKTTSFELSVAKRNLLRLAKAHYLFRWELSELRANFFERMWPFCLASRVARKIKRIFDKESSQTIDIMEHAISSYEEK